MIQLARPMGTEEERMRMQGPLYKPPQPMQMQPSAMQQAGQMAVNKSIDKAGEAMLEKAGAKTAAAAGAAMGDPTGGIASEVAYETAMPMLKQLIGGFFNKGGYVNGPLSMANINQVKYKQSGGKVAEEIEINYGGPLATRGV